MDSGGNHWNKSEDYADDKICQVCQFNLQVYQASFKVPAVRLHFRFEVLDWLYLDEHPVGHRGAGHTWGQDYR